jgi:hypothetical protein
MQRGGGDRIHDVASIASPLAGHYRIPPRTAIVAF